MAEHSFLLTGKVYAKEIGAAGPRLFLGNISNQAVNITENVISLKDFTKPGGGNWNEVRRVDSQEMVLDLREISRENLAIVFRATVTAVNSGTVSNEAGAFYKGGLHETVHPKPTSVVVTGTGGTPTYVAGTDYEVRDAGIYFLEGSAIAEAAVLEIDYSYAAYQRIETQINAAKEYAVLFEGLNEAQGGAYVIINFWRWKAGLPATFALIGEDFGTLSVTGQLLADTSKGAGLSQYMRIRKAT